MNSTQEEQLVVEVWFPIEKDADGYPRSRDSEALLCKPIDAECSLCNIASVPFYLRNVAFGDTVSTRDDGFGCLDFKEIVKRGGYSVYRILLHDLSTTDAAIKALLDFDVLLEHEGGLIAIAVSPQVNIDRLIDFILDGKDRGLWGAQDGYIADDVTPNSGRGRGTS